jgi:murein DD-endopeptidase MepM/ murein hydrolase activator NlpD
MQRAGQAAIDLAIQTNTAIVTTVDGKVVRITAAELIKQRQLTS